MDHSKAILHWRKYADLEETGSATVSTMLFACEKWLDRSADGHDQDLEARIVEIQRELETWLASRP